MTDTLAPPTGEDSDNKGLGKNAEAMAALADPSDAVVAIPVGVVEKNTEQIAPVAESSNTLEDQLLTKFREAASGARDETEFKQALVKYLDEVAYQLGMEPEDIFKLTDNGSLLFNKHNKAYQQFYDAYARAAHEFINRGVGKVASDRLSLARERRAERKAQEELDKQPSTEYQRGVNAIAKELGRAVENAQNLDEFNVKALEYLNSFIGAVPEGGQPLVQLVEKKGLLPDEIEKVLELNPQHQFYPLVSEGLAKARADFDKRTKPQKARDALSRIWNNNKERRRYDRYMREAYNDNDDRDEKLEADLLAQSEAEKDAAAERGRQIGLERKEKWDKAVAQVQAEKAQQDEARRQAEEKDKLWDEAIAENDAGFDALLQREVDIALRPVMAELNQFKVERQRLREAIKNRRLIDSKDVENNLNIEQEALLKKAAEVRKKTIEKLTADRMKTTKIVREQTREIAAFESNPKAEPHIYRPDDALHPEMAALIASSNAALVNAESEPFKIDEYDIKHDKADPTHMNRLIYKTAAPNVFVIEDWDKTSGKLKRQAIIKGDPDDLIVPERKGKGRFRRKTGEMTLSNDVYAKLEGGVIKSSDVISDSDTTPDAGYDTYVRNLSRGGRMSLDKARELAKPNPKFKTNKGFLALLQEEWQKNKTLKSKK